MNLKSLSRDRIKGLFRNVKKMEHWLDRLCGRMHQRYFPRDDPLKLSGEEARQAVAKMRAVIDDAARKDPKL